VASRTDVLAAAMASQDVDGEDAGVVSNIYNAYVVLEDADAGHGDDSVNPQIADSWRLIR